MNAHLDAEHCMACLFIMQGNSVDERNKTNTYTKKFGFDIKHLCQIFISISFQDAYSEKTGYFEEKTGYFEEQAICVAFLMEHLG